MKLFFLSILLAIVLLAPPGCGKDTPCSSSSGIGLQNGNFAAGVDANSSEEGCMSGIKMLQSSNIPSVEPVRDARTLLNYEHILTGAPDGRAESGFTPRKGPFPMTLLPGGNGVILTRLEKDEPWKVSSTLTYQIVPPNYVDFEFNIEIHDPTLFKPDAMFFFASYMNWVPSPEINFLGYADEAAGVDWVKSKANEFPGENYMHKDSLGTPFAEDAPGVVKMNLKNEEWPRIAEPFFYGMAGGGSVYALMFDQMISPEAEIRFSVMRFDLAERPSPAWDFAWVIRAPYLGQKARLRGRMMFKPFESAEDIHAEYLAWQSGLN